METHREYVQDAILALTFGILAVVSGYRSYLYFTLKGSGKVVTLFYLLIFTTTFVRCVWFGIPSLYLEGSYLPRRTMAFESAHWKGVFISELLLSVGTISMYAVFILLISFWANMLNKVEQSEHGESPKPRGPLETFSMVVASLLVMEAINMVLFLCRVYNAEVMILYDSAFFSVISLTCLYGISFFSYRIRIILQTLGYINAKSTRQQVQRILAITLAANIFFLFRVAIEVCIAISLAIHFLSSQSLGIAASHSLWSKCLLSKHWLEVGILALELVVSTSVSVSSRHGRGGHSSSRGYSRKSAGGEVKRRSNNPRRDPSEDDEFLPSALSEQPKPDDKSSLTSHPSENTPLLKSGSGGTHYAL